MTWSQNKNPTIKCLILVPQLISPTATAGNNRDAISPSSVSDSDWDLASGRNVQGSDLAMIQVLARKKEGPL